MKRGYEKSREYYCRTSLRCRGEEKAVQIVMGIAKSIIRAIFTGRKL